MNCPHGWTQIDPGTECASCARDRERAKSEAPRLVVKMLLECRHDRAERVDGAGRWCIDCGAYFPRRGPVSVRHPSVVTLAMLIDEKAQS